MKYLVVTIVLAFTIGLQAQEKKENTTILDKTQPADHQSLEAVHSTDPCAGITCSNHGDCVAIENRPVCSCNDGYRADPASGIGCIPVMYSTPKRIYTGVVYHRGLRKKKVGLILVTIGSTLLSSGVALLIPGVVIADGTCLDGDDCKDYSDTKAALITTGSISLAIGIGTLIPGIVSRIRGRNLIHQYERSKLHSASGRLHIAWMIHPSFHTAGLSLCQTF